MNIISRGKYRASLIYYLFSVFSFSDPCCGISPPPCLCLSVGDALLIQHLLGGFPCRHAVGALTFWRLSILPRLRAKRKKRFGSEQNYCPNTKKKSGENADARQTPRLDGVGLDANDGKPQPSCCMLRKGRRLNPQQGSGGEQKRAAAARMRGASPKNATSSVSRRKRGHGGAGRLRFAGAVGKSAPGARGGGRRAGVRGQPAAAAPHNKARPSARGAP